MVSDERRGRAHVLDKTLAGLENCRRHRLMTGVATSVCQTNIDLVSEAWLRRLIEMGVHYVWFHTYRVVGPSPNAGLALRPEQVLDVRRFIVKMRARLPIIIVDAYWDDQGQALCPMATGVSHHIGPSGDVEPCPIIQFATENVHDGAGPLPAPEPLRLPARLPRHGRPHHPRLHRPGAAGPGARAGGPARRARHHAARHARCASWKRCSRAAASTSPGRRCPRSTGRTASPRSTGSSASARTRRR